MRLYPVSTVTNFLLLLIVFSLLYGGAYQLTQSEQESLTNTLQALTAQEDAVLQDNRALLYALIESNSTIVGGWEDGNFKYSYTMLLGEKERLTLFVIHKINTMHIPLVTMLNMQEGIILLSDANRKEKLVWSGYLLPPPIQSNSARQPTPTQLSLTNFTTQVDENATIGTVIGKIAVRSSASIHNFIFTGSGNEYFSVDNQGYITTKKELDFDITPLYTLTAIATNANKESATATVSIAINNLQQYCPVLDHTTITIDENIPSGSVIGSIPIIKEGSSAIYNIELEWEGNGYFKVLSDGTIQTVRDLDYETIPFYSLQATATNIAGESEGVSVAIYLNNIDDNPPLLKASTLYVDENQTVGTTVGRVNFAALGDSAISNITLLGSGNASFAIDNEGNITLQSDLNFTQTPEYDLTMRATNTAGTSPTAVQERL